MTLPAPPLPLHGIVYSCTTVREAPGGFESQAPYQMALVQLEDGSLICAQLTDYDGEAQIGDPVEMVTRKLTTDGEQGMIVYGYKFRPPIK
ncbi:MAG: OB-fold domain-containing protein [Chloroflexi bacterium]|nr:OB-fold domain-containing protein [Chloroflexota bacterium]